MQEDEGEEETDFTPMSQDFAGESRRTFSIDSILPHRAVDPRPMQSSRLSGTPSSQLRDRSSKLLTCKAGSPDLKVLILDVYLEGRPHAAKASDPYMQHM